MSVSQRGYLRLGELVFEGHAFGASKSLCAEIVFSTALNGYVEMLTDPSFRGQILVLTAPHLGNYGVDLKQAQSSQIQVAALVVRHYTPEPLELSQHKSLGQWLQAAGVPALAGLDTRKLIQHIRSGTGQKATLSFCQKEYLAPLPEPHPSQVSVTQPVWHEAGPRWVILVDFGVKKALLHSLLKAQVSVLQVPWDYDWSGLSADGVVLSNGPGNPQDCEAAIEILARALTPTKPVLGICLGAQLLALAAGGQTYPLPYGHRGVNHPCRNLDTGRSYITSQNHGYVVLSESLPPDWQVWWQHEYDQSCAGLRHRTHPWCGVQFHPEAAPGPTETAFVLDEFIQAVKHA